MTDVKQLEEALSELANEIGEEDCGSSMVALYIGKDILFEISKAARAHLEALKQEPSAIEIQYPDGTVELYHDEDEINPDYGSYTIKNLYTAPVQQENSPDERDTINKQKPVAWAIQHNNVIQAFTTKPESGSWFKYIPLYTAPVPQEKPVVKLPEKYPLMKGNSYGAGYDTGHNDCIEKIMTRNPHIKFEVQE